MSQLKYWVWLSQKERITAHTRAELLLHFDTPRDIYFADANELKHVPGLTKRDIDLLLDKDLDPAERVLEKCDMGNISIMTMQDAAYPLLLKNSPDAPALLYYKGRMPAFDEEIGIAVIGTRSPSGYGLSIADQISYDIARGGGYIISGMARGLDSAAHRGALRAGKPTAAILGCGVDVVYPPENRELYHDIVAAGVVISEYPPGSEPAHWHFPERNRIISGVSLGVLIVEAGAKSGTLITARHAEEQGRDIFAVPGSINAPMSVGTNAIIRDGYAKLVVCAADVLCEYEHYRPAKILRPTTEPGIGPVPPAEPVKAAPAHPVDRKLDKKKIEEFSAERQKILLALTDGPKYLDDIVEASGMETNRVVAEITMLVLEELVVELAGKRYAPGEKLLV